jgi:hypothetical protein
MNTTLHEALFADLSPTQAAVIEGGISFCPYTTRGANTRLRIRSGSSTSLPIVGF